jgi:hypothetical protein
VETILFGDRRGNPPHRHHRHLLGHRLQAFGRRSAEAAVDGHAA